MDDFEVKQWFNEFTAYFTPFNKPLAEGKKIDSALLENIMVCDPTTDTLVHPFPDTLVNPTDPDVGEEERNHAKTVLYNLAGNNQLIIPTAEGPRLLGIGEDGSPKASPIDNETLDRLYPPSKDNSFVRWFKRTVNRIFPSAFKDDIQREENRERAARAFDSIQNNPDLTMRSYTKRTGYNQRADELRKELWSSVSTLDGVGYHMVSCLNGLSGPEQTELSRDKRLRANFALFAGESVLKNCSKEDVDVFLTGNTKQYSDELKMQINSAYMDFKAQRDIIFANSKLADIHYTDPNASLECIHALTAHLSKEPELSLKHSFAAQLARGYAGIVMKNVSENGMIGNKKLTAGDKSALGFATYALPTMGEVYLESLGAEENVFSRSADEGPNPDPTIFTRIISKDIVNAIIADNHSVLNSLPPEEEGTIPMKAVNSSMQALCSNMFTKDNMANLITECRHFSLIEDPDFLGAHVNSSKADRLQIGRIFEKEGKTLVYDKVSRQAEPSVEIKTLENTADVQKDFKRQQILESAQAEAEKINRENAKEAKKTEESPVKETGVVKFNPRQNGF